MGYLSIAAHAPGKLCFNCGEPTLCQTPQAQGRAVPWEAGWWPSLITAAASRPAPEHSTESHTMEKLSPGYLSVISAAKLLCTVSFLFFPAKFLAWLMEDREEMHPSKTASLGFAGALFCLLALS